MNTETITNLVINVSLSPGPSSVQWLTHSRCSLNVEYIYGPSNRVHSILFKRMRGENCFNPTKKELSILEPQDSKHSVVVNSLANHWQRQDYSGLQEEKIQLRYNVLLKEEDSCSAFLALWKRGGWECKNTESIMSMGCQEERT